MKCKLKSRYFVDFENEYNEIIIEVDNINETRLKIENFLNENKLIFNANLLEIDNKLFSHWDLIDYEITEIK